MIKRRHPLRSLGLVFVILWSIVPIYWAAKTSLQTESAARARPVEYIPLHPNLDNFRTLLFGQGTVAVAMVEAVIVTVNIFDQPYVLNGAASTGASVTMETYFVSFQNLNFGQGYALSLIVALLTVVLSVLVIRFVYRKVEL